MRTRLHSLKEIAQRAATLEAWGLALAEWLDDVNALRRIGRSHELLELIRDEPPLLNGRIVHGETADAFAAALADYIAQSAALPTPAWTRRPERFLAEPWFPLPQIAGQPSLRELIERETPPAFRERNVFIDEHSLART